MNLKTQQPIQEKQINQNEKDRDFELVLQNCPRCQAKISALPGTRDAICKNCGFKDPCCE